MISRILGLAELTNINLWNKMTIYTIFLFVTIKFGLASII